MASITPRSPPGNSASTAEHRIPAPVKGLAAVSLLNDFASEMVYPLLPALVVSLGGGAVALGALDGAADLASSSLRWWSGRRADRPGWRRPLIMVGYLAAVVLRPVTGLVGHAWQVVAIRTLDRVGKGLRSPARDALVADLTPAPIRGRAFGLHRTADHLGAVLGSLLAFELIRRGTEVRDILVASLVPGLIAVLVLAAALARTTEPAPAAAVSADSDEGRPAAALRWLAVLAAVRFPETLLLLRLQDAGLALAAVPLVWAALHVVKSVASYPAGQLADRLGPTAGLGLGSLAYAVTILALGGTGSPRAAVAAFLAHGLAAGLIEPAERAAVARVAGSRRGRAFGSYQAMAGVGALATGLGYGWLYQNLGGGPALLAAAGISAAALFGWLLRARVQSGVAA